MTIFAAKKKRPGLETWEIDAVYQTEQRQVGEHMDIYRGLSQLKEVERTCITLFFMEDLPIEKIAVITRNACRNNQVPFISAEKQN